IYMSKIDLLSFRRITAREERVGVDELTGEPILYETKDTTQEHGLIGSHYDFNRKIQAFDIMSISSTPNDTIKDSFFDVIVLSCHAVPVLYFYDMKYKINIMYRGIFESACPISMVTDQYKPQYVYVACERYQVGHFIVGYCYFFFCISKKKKIKKKDDWRVRIELQHFFPYGNSAISVKSLINGFFQVSNFYWILPPYLFDELCETCTELPPVILRLVLNFSHIIDAVYFLN
ncbi:hypothetical protein RFI_08481, partial [Reticulomyxa filosa]